MHDETTPHIADGLPAALAHISDKWSLRVINQLATTTMRFGDLRRAVTGISSRMLTETVRKLERDGIISRRVGAEHPPNVHYTLTTLGRCLLITLSNVDQWFTQHRDTIADNRRRYDARTLPAASARTRSIR